MNLSNERKQVKNRLFVRLDCDVEPSYMHSKSVGKDKLLMAVSNLKEIPKELVDVIAEISVLEGVVVKRTKRQTIVELIYKDSHRTSYIGFNEESNYDLVAQLIENLH